MIAANRAWLAVFDGLEEVGPGTSYVEILQIVTEEGVVDIGDMSPAAWREWIASRAPNSAAIDGSVQAPGAIARR